MNTKKFLIRLLVGFVVIFLLYVVVVLVHGTLTDFQPEQETTLTPLQESTETVIQDSVLSAAIWNVGYGGLGAESHFFYDSGNMWWAGSKMVRSDRAWVERNVQAMAGFVSQTEADFFLFQEVDWSSKRSYYTAQVDSLRLRRPDYSAWFSVNYKADRVPIPILEPWRAYGPTHSGLMTLSRIQASRSTRYQLPGNFSWPNRIFSLDRCAAVHRYPVKNGKELVLVNVHNSAYDADGSLKREQMAYLQTFFLEEYEKGNYVVVGGDWNQCPPYFPFDSFMPGRTQGYTQINIDPDYLPSDWRWGYDPRTPTNRKTKEGYQPGETFETLIDFFLVSPNVKVRTVKGIAQNFQFSDHQPVWMEFELLDFS
jgi:endonuclease/exonuclease/phosphatase family metal-dependent hydrolase